MEFNKNNVQMVSSSSSFGNNMVRCSFPLVAWGMPEQVRLSSNWGTSLQAGLLSPSSSSHNQAAFSLVLPSLLLPRSGRQVATRFKGCPNLPCLSHSQAGVASPVPSSTVTPFPCLFFLPSNNNNGVVH